MPISLICLSLSLLRSTDAAPQDSLSFRSVSAGATHTCALSTDGAAYCWGDNLEGELGTGDRAISPVPRPVAGGIRFLSIDAGVEFTCGIATTGEAYCWGRNDTHALGNASMPRSVAPVLVAGGRLFRSVAAGADHACGLTVDGVAYCWGANAHGQLGTGDTLASQLPALVAGSLRLLSITAGDEHTCAIGADSLAYCWGGNRRGQLGTGGSGDAFTPRPVAQRLHWRLLSAGARHTCGILADRPSAYCWGDNFHGQVSPSGESAYPIKRVPIYVASSALLVSAGRWHTCFVWGRGANSLSCRGADFDDQLGQSVFGSFVDVTAGDAHTCGLTKHGEVYCWGRNAAGQLGDGTQFGRRRPVRVVPPLDLDR